MANSPLSRKFLPARGSAVAGVATVAMCAHTSMVAAVCSMPQATPIHQLGTSQSETRSFTLDGDGSAPTTIYALGDGNGYSAKSPYVLSLVAKDARTGAILCDTTDAKNMNGVMSPFNWSMCQFKTDAKGVSIAVTNLSGRSVTGYTLVCANGLPDFGTDAMPATNARRAPAK